MRHTYTRAYRFLRRAGVTVSGDRPHTTMQCSKSRVGPLGKPLSSPPVLRGRVGRGRRGGRTAWPLAPALAPALALVPAPVAAAALPGRAGAGRGGRRAGAFWRGAAPVPAGRATATLILRPPTSVPSKLRTAVSASVSRALWHSNTYIMFCQQRRCRAARRKWRLTIAQSQSLEKLHFSCPVQFDCMLCDMLGDCSFEWRLEVTSP